jgi:hypothetical protein
VADVVAAAREYERVEALTSRGYQIEQELSLLRAQRQGFERAATAIPAAREAFDRALARVYRDPDAARDLIRAAAETQGAERVDGLLRQEPERFGALKTVEQSRAFGLMTVDDDALARASARGAAADWRALAGCEANAATSARAYAHGAEQRMREAFEQVYRAPTVAYAAFELAVANAGTDEALRTLAQSPDRFGALRAPGTPIPVAHLEWQALGERAHQAIDARLVTSSDLPRAHTEQTIARIGDRRRELRAAVDSAPTLDLLRRAVSCAANRLEPSELADLRRVLTSPQAAIVFKARTALREMVLGRDETRTLTGEP